MIALLTPTGNRREQLRNCVRWMQNQTYKGEVLWVITDDCIPTTIDVVKTYFDRNWTINILYPKPAWQTGQNTQARNLYAGLRHIQNQDVSHIFIIEDDDYYRPVYLERMMSLFNGYDVIGEMKTIYYNVVTRKWLRNMNTIHSSLFQTAITKDGLIDIFRSMGHKFIDAELWKIAENKMLFQENDLAIGIKGMPGRAGIGAGHRSTMTMNSDTNMVVLKKLIGDDAEYFSGCYSDNGNAQHDILGRKRY